MIKINDKFKTLFEQPENIRYYIVTGGRGSGKSYGVGLWANLKTYELNTRVLYTRYTLTSAHLSIIPEFAEKIEVLNAENNFQVNKDRITNITTNSDIVFKGIKTSSGNQTANLKSLQGVSVWILDEAEELDNEDTFDKIDLSIRTKDSQNIVVLILNPTIKEHWIYKRFFEQKNIPDGFNGVSGNVCYIHSTYLDNLENLDESFLNNVEEIKQNDPDKYNHVILGGWLEHLDGVLFKKSELNFYNSKDVDLTKAQAKAAYIDVADTGTDYHSAPVGYLIDNKVYIEDVVFTTEDHTVHADLTANLLNKHEPSHVRIENNGLGAMYPSIIKPKIKDTIMLLPVRAKTKKHTRIVSQSYFIKNYFVFRNDYEQGSAYDLFMRNLTQYLKDGSSEHEDAPDSLEGLAQLFRSFYSSNWSLPDV